METCSWWIFFFFLSSWNWLFSKILNKKKIKLQSNSLNVLYGKIMNVLWKALKTWAKKSLKLNKNFLKRNFLLLKNGKLNYKRFSLFAFGCKRKEKKSFFELKLYGCSTNLPNCFSNWLSNNHRQQRGKISENSHMKEVLFTRELPNNVERCRFFIAIHAPWRWKNNYP